MSEENEENQENNEKSHKLQVGVIVDESDELKQLKEDKADLEAKLQLIAEKAFNKEKERLGAPEEINTPEALEGWRLAKESSQSNPFSKGASGKALLQNEPSISQESKVKEYDTYEEMLKDLEDRAHSEDKAIREEAEEIKKQLFEKYRSSKRSHNFEGEIDLSKITKPFEDAKEKVKKAVKERGY